MTEFIEFTRVHILDLPHDLLLNCLARVSRLYYPTLCLVSKRFRSLITSLELYQTRALLGRTESCLYLCLRLSYGSKQCWYTLCKRPTPSPYLTLSLSLSLSLSLTISQDGSVHALDHIESPSRATIIWSLSQLANFLIGPGGLVPQLVLLSTRLANISMVGSRLGSSSWTVGLTLGTKLQAYR